MVRALTLDPRPTGRFTGVRHPTDHDLAESHAHTTDRPGALDHAAAVVRVGLAVVAAVLELDVAHGHRTEHLRAAPIRAGPSTKHPAVRRARPPITTSDPSATTVTGPGPSSAPSPMCTVAADATMVTGPGPSRAPEATEITPPSRVSRVVDGYSTAPGRTETPAPIRTDPGSSTRTSGASAVASWTVRNPAERRAMSRARAVRSLSIQRASHMPGVR
ncbi:hypothetical protein DEJ21_03840 [Curtobacterium sp. MCSS17_006]|nr:hypothetical protein DEJ21_03840 [Curtobacterium sp. MCSS17_006]